MAKADGVVTKDEVLAFKKAFNVSDAEMKHAAQAFNRAKHDAAGYEACAQDVVNVFRGDRKMLAYVLEGLFHIVRPTRCCTLKKNNSFGRSRSASVSLTLSSPS